MAHQLPPWTPGGGGETTGLARRSNVKSLDSFLSPETKDGRGWKNRLRERCMERIKVNRDRLLLEIRGLSPSPMVGAGNSTPFRELSPIPPQTPMAFEKAEDSEERRRSVSKAAMLILEEEMGEGRMAVVASEGATGEDMQPMIEVAGDDEGLSSGIPSVETEGTLSAEEYLELMQAVELAIEQEMRHAGMRRSSF